jgi:hypothetical protein
MSDFLGDLAARSMGMAATIQPRIPPLFEPQGRESGLISARPRSRTDAAEARSDDDSPDETTEADEAEAPVAKKRPSLLRPEPMRWEKRPARPVEPVRTEPPVEPRVPTATVVNEVPMDIPNVVADAAPPTALPTRNRIPAAPEIKPPTLNAFDTPERQVKAARESPVLARFVSNDPPDADTHEPAPLRPPPTLTVTLPGQPLARTDVPVRAPRHIETSSSDRLNVPSPERAAGDHMSVAQTSVSPGSPREVARPAEALPQMPPAGLPDRLATDPQVPNPPHNSENGAASEQRPAFRGTASMPTFQAASTEPPVRITIGRVEVRAVFPEPAARPAPSRRSKPTVSLDDYLKQSGRGNR